MDGRKKTKKESTDAEKLLLPVPARLCLLDSAEHPSLLWAGVNYRKLLLYNSKSWGSVFFFPSSSSSSSSSFSVPCLCGWLLALSLFHGCMHVEGITARIFKETAAYFQKQSGRHVSRDVWDSSMLHLQSGFSLLKNKRHYKLKV